MRKRILLFVLLAAAAGLCAGLLLLPRPSAPVSASMPDSPLVRFEFSEQASYMKPVQRCIFSAEQGAYTVSFYLTGEEDAFIAAADQAWVDQLTELIRQYEMMAWDGFQGAAPGALDGTQFILSFAFADGTCVSARGENRFPQGYRQAAAAIDAHFMKLLPESLRDRSSRPRFPSTPSMEVSI